MNTLKKMFLFGILLQISLSSFSQKNLANVNKIQGFYVFVDAQPIAEYDILGQVNVDPRDPEIKRSGGQYQAVRDNLIKVGRQSNLTADGIILTLINGGTDKGELIKFKDGQTNKSQARVTQFQGLYLFVDSNPISDTDYLGTVKKSYSLIKGGQYSVLRDAIIKKCKSDFRDAQGIVIKFVQNGADTGDAIKFK
jgi:hypothetical protein